ncbi:MAG: GNAT family N-acetyltransferase [Dehalococcoidia bacterium]
MKSETIEKIERAFAENFEVSPRALSLERVLVRAHPQIYAEYAGAQLLRTPHGYLLTVLPEWLERATKAVRDVPAASVFDVQTLSAIFGDAADVAIGPSTIAYADEEVFRPATPMGERLLTREDAEAMIEFREACDPLEWNHGGAISPAQHPTFALYVDGAIVAAASYDYQGEYLRHAGVITHPGHRGKGYGAAVASALTAHGLGEGGIMQWQTLFSNVPSLRIGRALGYEPWVETMAVHFRS